MSLIRRFDSPVFGGSFISDFFDDDRFFNPRGMTNSNAPAVNIRENEKDYEIELAAPGYDKKDFNISVDNGLLTISANRQEEKQVKEDNYTRREFGYSSFTRSFNLPTNTSEENINAKYRDGVLKIMVEKKETDNKKTRKEISIR